MAAGRKNNDDCEGSSSSSRSGGDPQKIVIFDWDDTICPSSFVDRCGVDYVSELPVPFQHVFTEICHAAERCLEEASKYGQVIIITNSDDGWVKYSCARYLPQLLPVMERYRIVSARTGYERFYPNQPLCWKAAAFAHEVNEVFGSASSPSPSPMAEDDDEDDGATSLESTDVSSDDSSTEAEATTTTTRHSPPAAASPPRQVVSFGDSTEERTAVRIVAEQLGATPKSVMFVQAPTPAQIVGQLVMLRDYMRFVCDHAAALDLEINANQAEECASAYLTERQIHVSQQQLVRHAELRGRSASLDESDDGIGGGGFFSMCY